MQTVPALGQKTNFSKVFEQLLSISIQRSQLEPQNGFWGHTTYSGWYFSDENMDAFAEYLPKKVVRMSDLYSKDYLKDQNQRAEPTREQPADNDDLVMEKILENISTTPIGQVLKKIASLPEVRREKVLDVRRQITEGRYDINERLNIAVDKVLEDLTA